MCRCQCIDIVDVSTSSYIVKILFLSLAVDEICLSGLDFLSKWVFVDLPTSEDDIPDLLDFFFERKRCCWCGCRTAYEICDVCSDSHVIAPGKGAGSHAHRCDRYDRQTHFGVHTCLRNKILFFVGHGFVLVKDRLYFYPYIFL